MSDTATDTTTRLTVHANCDHPATKAARAACRRARTAPAPVWVDATRESVAKGDTVRVTLTDEAVLEGELIGWGAKRMIVAVTGGQRHQLAADTIAAVQARA